jgi:hypothetical protein
VLERQLSFLEAGLMKSKFLALALMAMAFFAAGTAQAGVVLSNMGANGLTDTSGPTNTDILANNWLAAGFTTGADALKLDWVSGVGFNNDTGTKTVSIYSDNAGSPGTLIATSTGAPLGLKNVYQFNFSGVNLAAATSYWVLPEVGISWYMESGNAAPTAQNASGFSYLGIKTSTNSGSSWNTSPFNYTFAVSASPAAVPEPAITSLVCVGGIAFMRRRMKK